MLRHETACVPGNRLARNLLVFLGQVIFFTECGKLVIQGFCVDGADSNIFYEEYILPENIFSTGSLPAVTRVGQMEALNAPVELCTMVLIRAEIA